MEKIKIAYLISDLSIGGIQKVVLDICTNIDLNTFQVIIYCFGEADEMLAGYKLHSSIKIKKFPYFDLDDFSWKGYTKAFYAKSKMRDRISGLLKDLLTEKPDIVHTHLHPRALQIGGIIEKEVGCKLIATQHMTFFETKSFSGKIISFFLRFSYKKYHLIAVGKQVAIELKTHRMLGKNKRLELIENKINLKIFNPLPKVSAGFVSVVYVARIGIPKAHKELIEAWSLLNNHPVKKKLILVGPDFLNGEIQKLAREIVTDNSVEFYGNRLDIADILNTCDFGVFPSFQEGMPIALLEKMAMELPVIVSDIPSLTNIVDHNKDGLVFKPGDVKDLSEKIATLLEDAELRTRLGKEARKKTHEKYGSENPAAPNEKLYREILGKN